MTVKDVLTDENALKRTLVVTAVLLVIGGVVFLGLRIYEGIKIQHSVSLQEEQLAALEARFLKHQQTSEERLSRLESFLFGEVTSELKTVAADHKDAETTAGAHRALDAWLLKRDAELRSRIEQLERWRLLSGRQ